MDIFNNIYFIGSLVTANIIAIALVINYILYKKIKNIIQSATFVIGKKIENSVEQKFIEFAPSVDDISSIAVEIWRINKRVEKLTLPENSQKPITTSIEKLISYLKNKDIEITDYTGLKYNDGLNVDILSVNDGVQMENALIVETVEPAISYRGKITKKAKVIL
jgi:hypothetical protein